MCFMETIKEIYKIGFGPSSSHTMGPHKAAEIFAKRHGECHSFRVTLYGSLAATGKGHLTDKAINDVLSSMGGVEIVWEPKIFLPYHPNGMKFEALDGEGRAYDSWTVFSVGGGSLSEGEGDVHRLPDIYEMKHLTDIKDWCERTGKSYWEYVNECEDSDIWDYLHEAWGLVFSYALAVSEENASGGKIVTAPTCGSSGVMPAVLYHLQETRDFSDARILRAMATAGVIGNIAKANASISGAEVGCQGEVGVACAMASAAACQLFGGSAAQIEYAAEMGLEHHLGMTCDPVCGLVQIPCIERNAYAAARALDANIYSSFTDGKHRVSYDRVVEVMKQTGKDIPSLYKETSEGGLAKGFKPM